MFTITLLQRPESQNKWERFHWSERKALKEKWAWEFFVVGNFLPRDCKHITLTARIYFPEKRRRDAENYAAVLWKMTNDTLVDLHIIPDDTPEYISTSNPELLVDSQMPRTEIDIEVKCDAPPLPLTM